MILPQLLLLPLLLLLLLLLVLLLLQGSGHFSFCSHSWIYDPASKSRILQLENQMQQLAAFENSMMQVGPGTRRLHFVSFRYQLLKSVTSWPPIMRCGRTHSN
jgi:hypothetical protein